MTTQRGVFDFLRARGEEFLTQVSNELMSNPRFIQAMQAAVRGKEWVDQAVARALRTMNVPTRTEFKQAVARLWRRLQAFRKHGSDHLPLFRSHRLSGAGWFVQLTIQPGFRNSPVSFYRTKRDL